MSEPQELADKIVEAIKKPDLLSFFRLINSPAFVYVEIEDSEEYSLLARFVELPTHNKKHGFVLRALFAKGCDPSRFCEACVVPDTGAKNMNADMQELWAELSKDKTPTEEVEKWLKMSSDELERVFGSRNKPATVYRAPEPTVQSQAPEPVAELQVAQPESEEKGQLSSTQRERLAPISTSLPPQDSRRASSPSVRDGPTERSRKPRSQSQFSARPPTPSPKYTGRLPPDGWNEEAARLHVTPPCAARWIRGVCSRPACPFTHNGLPRGFGHWALRGSSPPAESLSKADRWERSTADRRSRSPVARTERSRSVRTRSEEGHREMSPNTTAARPPSSEHVNGVTNGYAPMQVDERPAMNGHINGTAQINGQSVEPLIATPDWWTDAKLAKLKGLNLSPEDEAMILDLMRTPEPYDACKPPAAIRQTVRFRETSAEDALQALNDPSLVGYPDDPELQKRFISYLNMCAHGDMAFMEPVFLQIAQYNDGQIRTAERTRGLLSNGGEIAKGYDANAEPRSMMGNRGQVLAAPTRGEHSEMRVSAIAAQLTGRSGR